MLKNPDHVTVVVEDLEAAKGFFSSLGFEQSVATVISGATFSDYMGVPGIEADHVSMALRGCAPRFEIQLLRYRKPNAIRNPRLRELNHVGFNHLCFTVDDIEAEVARLVEHGIRLRNEILDFHNRKLVFVEGPEGITIELAQWY